MKMAKKLLAVVLTGVMAVSMLTGCADLKTRKIADDLEGMLKTVNDKATVSTTNAAQDLAKDAAKAAKDAKTDFAVFNEGGSSSTPSKTNIVDAVKAKLDTENITDKYVWATCFETKDVKNAAQAQKIYEKIVDTENKTIKTSAALNSAKVKVNGKTGENVVVGNKFELGMETFTIGSGKDKTDYVMVVVTAKAYEKAATITPAQPVEGSEE